MDGHGANLPGVIALRRDLHAFPETGFLEYRTAALAAETLSGLGYAVRVGPEVMRADAMAGRPSEAAILAAQQAARAAGTPEHWIARMPGGQPGVVAELTRGEGPVLAFRFDMDALPVLETVAAAHRPVAEGFASGRPGTMHACGHDGHTAIGLTLAARLAADTGWRGRLRLIFQPTEEGGRGAKPMAEAGILDDVDWFFCGHLGCLLPSGKVAARATGFLFSRKLDVVFTGRAAHAAMGPQEGRNALLAAAAAALGLHAIARHATEATHVNVGRLVAGTGRNIIADRAEMQIEVRGETEAGLAYMAGRAEAVIAGAAAMQGVTFTTQVMGETISADTSPEAAAIVARAGAGLAEMVPDWPIGGGDDATFMMRAVQRRGGKAAYFILGADLAAVHHAVDFDIDEAALETGVRLFTRIAHSILGPGPAAQEPAAQEHAA
ncbi:MAG: amidohydrolase [Rhodospirillales bacterium 70-18]|nr:amidohydrolase [Rhodospirillales bacterium]OJY73515.1 MAG: amidohydrolase [Rhodospirillales bacterium 70-18]